MKTFEAGVTEIIFPFHARWSGKFIEAENEEQAEFAFESQGFYRNLVVREIQSYQPRPTAERETK